MAFYIQLGLRFLVSVTRLKTLKPTGRSRISIEDVILLSAGGVLAVTRPMQALRPVPR